MWWEISKALLFIFVGVPIIIGLGSLLLGYTVENFKSVAEWVGVVSLLVIGFVLLNSGDKPTQTYSPLEQCKASASNRYFSSSKETCKKLGKPIDPNNLGGCTLDNEYEISVNKPYFQRYLEEIDYCTRTYTY